MKWNKRVFADVEVTPTVADFKAKLQELTVRNLLVLAPPAGTTATLHKNGRSTRCLYRSLAHFLSPVVRSRCDLCFRALVLSVALRLFRVLLRESSTAVSTLREGCC